ncbi:MAG: CRTAC1 family protein [Lewinellaceae bacterium]|nr:CRTAC1 family protein [Lewinellaceae bacterium]
MGIAVADYDLDNDLDIFVVAKFDFNSSDKTTWSRLFQNNNDGTFTDVTREAGFRGLYNFNAEDPGFGYGVKLGASWGDYDNDGYPDLILTNYLRIQLFHNNGDGTFQEVTQAVGLTAVNGCYNTSALWWDFNRDGHLDLYITKVGLCPANQLYQNDGDGTFTQVTAQTGTSGTKSRTWMALPVDVNADGWLDLYLSNDFAANELFVNNTGTNFSDQANAFGVDISGNDKGMALGDYNHDGRPDIYITNIGNNRLLTQQPNQTFSNLAQDKNVLRAFYAWNSKFADFDLDGDEDLFVANGYQNDPIFFPDNKTNFLFKNLTREGQDSFTDWSAPANLVESSNTMGMEVFDYDNDGDLDIFLANMDDQPYFYENQTITSNSPQNQHWAKIKLTGTTSNRDGLGSVLRISAQGFTQTRFNQGAGLLSQSLQPVHVGLANADQIDSLKIIWPSGIEEVYYDLPVDKTLTLTEGSGIEIQTITNQKVYGCTDPNSCSYNPLATVDDGSCTYLPALTITGATAAGFLQTQTYTCPETAGSTYQWRVTHGEILQGQGTATVTVQWALATAGTISVKEVNTCSSIPSQMSVTLTGQNSTAEQSVARLWNEALLNAIRKDFARPTVHARNLFHTSVAMYDAWAIYDQQAQTFLIGKEVGGFQSTFAGFEANEPLQTARNKTISYAAYRLLSHRFAKSPGRANSLAIFDLLMAELGYDTQFTATDYSSGDAAALGEFSSPRPSSISANKTEPAGAI